MERLLATCGSAEGVFYASDKQLLKVLKKEDVRNIRERSKTWKVTEEYEKISDKGIHMVCRCEDEYPKRLRNIKQSPYLLYYMGSLPREDKVAVAVIGARECSEYGAYVAKAFSERLAASGVNIISGMARGIDSIGQKAALMAGGRSFAVLGCGVDVCYPASNRSLYEEMKRQGGILSPFLPGQMPQKNLFPYRNKIVAGLADCVLVIEARQKSGTWITVDMALEQGKEVYAVPGRLTDRLSDGCNLLIKQGAGVALSPEDMLAELSVLGNRKEMVADKKKENAERKKADEEDESGEQRQAEGIICFLDLIPKAADEILEQVRMTDNTMTYSKLMVLLVQLCMTGKARCVNGNYFMRKADDNL